VVILPVGERLFFAGDYSYGDFSVSENGALIYRVTKVGPESSHLVRSPGHLLDTVADLAFYRDCRLSRMDGILRSA